MKFKIRKFFTACCIALGLVLSVPSLLSTLGFSDTITSVSAAADGWNKDDQGKYYVKDGQRLTGLQTIGKGKYYFNADGYMQTGPVKIGTVTYYFRLDNGRLYTGVSGLKKSAQEANIYYYFSSKRDGSVATSAWVTHKSKYYYASPDGRVRLGTLKIGTKLYHVTKSGRLYGGMKKSSYNKKYYYADSNGVLKTGLQTIGDKLYYFHPSKAYRVTGTVKSGKYTYYFDQKSASAKTGWVKISGKYYYHTSNGRRVTGFKTITSGNTKNTYYFDSSKNGARLENGWYKIDSYYYYFNTSGVMQTGLIRTNNRLYYADSKGRRKSGWQEVNGKRYYFLKNKNNEARTAWYTIGDKTYYFYPVYSSADYGVAKTGMVKSGGYWYYLSPTDYSRQTGWVRHNMRDYYFDKTTGRMLTGTHTIDGKLYHFGISGGITVANSVSGSWSIKVNRKQNFVVVYKGNTEMKAFVCSTSADGVSTPTGSFTLMDKLRWHELNGPSWGQYCHHITWNILFHSVPCTQYRNPYSLKASYYNQLGSPASAGCIRLTVEHAKWIYDYCPIGTSVYISDYVAKPTKVTIEKAPKIPLTQTYDPTDPNLPENRL